MNGIVPDQPNKPSSITTSPTPARKINDNKLARINQAEAVIQNIFLKTKTWAGNTTAASA